MRDEMDEAHARDTRYEADLRTARHVLVELAQHPQTTNRVSTECLKLAERLKREEDHIVARWN